MGRDGEAQMIAFYLLRGHSLDELFGLGMIEKMFYIAAMEKYAEEVSKVGKQKVSRHFKTER